MVQFMIDIAQAVYGYLYRGFCVYSISYGVIMLALFGNYYLRAFVYRKNKPPEEKKEN